MMEVITRLRTYIVYYNGGLFKRPLRLGNGCMIIITVLSRKWLLTHTLILIMI